MFICMSASVCPPLNPRARPSAVATRCPPSSIAAGKKKKSFIRDFQPILLFLPLFAFIHLHSAHLSVDLSDSDICLAAESRRDAANAAKRFRSLGRLLWVFLQVPSPKQG